MASDGWMHLMQIFCCLLQTTTPVPQHSMFLAHLALCEWVVTKGLQSVRTSRCCRSSLQYKSNFPISTWSCTLVPRRLSLQTWRQWLTVRRDTDQPRENSKVKKNWQRIFGQITGKWTGTFILLDKTFWNVRVLHRVRQKPCHSPTETLPDCNKHWWW